MEIHNKYSLLILLSVFVINSFAAKEPYAVYFGGHLHGSEPTSKHFERAKNIHHEFLGNFLGGHEKAKNAMIYSHTKHINAFSAMLEPEEAKEISKQDTILSIFKCQGLQMHTIKTWKTLGLEKEDGLVPSDSLWNKTNFGEDIIIANMDSGVDPSSRSFQDDGMGPIPSKWKGHCDAGSSCNRKLISRRMFVKAFVKTFGEDAEYSNLTDLVGHGTHTLSTAGGRFVPGVSVKGFNGTVKGGAPNARLASYKITLLSCDVLAALDEAIHDGVDVVSISMGEKDNLDGQYNAGVAIGTLHAVKKGIVTVMCAGNDGPQEGCVQNLPPWVITVGASQDRTITVNVELGNKQRIKGKSFVDKWSLQNKLYPLTRFIDISKPNTTKAEAPAESPAQSPADSPEDFPAAEECRFVIDPKKVNGSIIVYEHEQMECTNVLGELGAVGYISINSTCSSKDANAATLAMIPDPVAGQILTTYINSTESPMASITPPVGEETTPFVARYSCRGPNPVTQEILKPDIIAPGTYIVAALSKEMVGSDGRLYAAQSGTSMSTPAVAGVVGLLKLIHPEWSPAMIKSAIMTTASTIDNMDQPMKDYDGKPATPFAMGAGTIQPNNAADPGLVYDLTVKDYLEFLCSQTNFTETQLASVYEKPFTCPKSYNLLNFNYPSITVPKLSNQVTLSRTVTNVGTPGLYKVNVTEPEGISVTVKPESLLFKEVGEMQTFELTLKAKEVGAPKNYVFGRIVWKDGVHTVSSPLVVKGA